MQVSRNTPRGLVILSDDDGTVAPANGVNYYNELYRHDVPASLFVFPDGGHGWGMRPRFKYQPEMLLLIKSWLSSFLKKFFFNSSLASLRDCYFAFRIA